jgi:hypothetical protein
LSGIQIGSELDLNLSPANPDGEYTACPNVLSFAFFADGGDDLVTSDPVTTSLTLVPCTEDIENGVPANVTATFDIVNEFEDHLSASVHVDCWLDRTLGLISQAFTPGNLGTVSGHARLTPSPGQGGLLGVAEEIRSGRAAAAFNLQGEGNRFDAAGVTDTITIPSL